MKLYALLPKKILASARKGETMSFSTHCALGRNSASEVTLIVTVQDRDGKILDGTQFVADLKMDSGMTKDKNNDRRKNKICV